MTRDHVLVIPERRGVALAEPLTLGEGANGTSLALPAGRGLRSYLIHCDPHLVTGRAPHGTVEFAGPVAAVIAESGRSR